MSSLIINPIGGIANRFRAIVSGVSLAKELKVPMKIVWPINSDLAAPVDELINTDSLLENIITDISIRNVSAFRQLFLYDPPRKKNLYTSGIAKIGKYGLTLNDNQLITHPDKFNVQAFKEILARSQDILISSGLQFYDFSDEFYRQLINPLPRYELQAMETLKGNKTIGLHIRRTDNVMSIKHSPLNLFSNAVDFELQCNPDANFYLASDNEDVKTFFLKRYGTERIKTSSHRADRSSLTGIKNAFLEMILLSKCSKIYGSFYSSFSEAAAKLGNIKLETLKCDT